MSLPLLLSGILANFKSSLCISFHFEKSAKIANLADDFLSVVSFKKMLEKSQLLISDWSWSKILTVIYKILSLTVFLLSCKSFILWNILSLLIKSWNKVGAAFNMTVFENSLSQNGFECFAIKWEISKLASVKFFEVFTNLHNKLDWFFTYLHALRNNFFFLGNI